MLDNRGLIRKLAEYNPNFKLLVLAKNGPDEITAYGVKEEDISVVNDSVVIDLSKHIVEKLDLPEIPEEPNDEIEYVESKEVSVYADLELTEPEEVKEAEETEEVEETESENSEKDV